MNKLNFDEETKTDEDFFSGLDRRTNLGQLFGVAVKEDDAGDQTLKYQPTKQPVEVPPAAGQTWNTQLAKVANAYKTGEAVGKVGVALLRNAEGACKIIVYRSKTNILATLTLQLSGDSGGQLRKNRYLQFYDDDGVYWSLLFDKPSDEQEFVKQLREQGIKIQAPKNVESRNDAVESSRESPVKSIVEKPAPIEEPQTNTNAQPANKNTKTEHSKHSLISRMAKVGQQLPQLASQQTSTEYSDSSDAEVISTPLAISNKPMVAPRCAKLLSKSQVVAAPNSLSMYNVGGGGAPDSPMEAHFMQMLLTENRTQNTEIRMNINKLEGKIERVLDKIDHLNTDDQCKPDEDEVLELEEKILALKKENRKLKRELRDNAARNASNTVESTLEIFKEDLEKLGLSTQQDLEDVLVALLGKLTNCQSSLRKSETEILEKNAHAKSSETNLAEAKEEHSRTLHKLNELQTSVETLKTTLELREKDFADLQDKLSTEAKLNLSQVEQQKSQIEMLLKNIMNSLYANLVAKILNTDQKLSTDVICTFIGVAIKEETLKAIEQFSNTNSWV